MKRFSWLLALFFGVSLVYAQNEKEVIHGISYRVKMSLTKNMQESVDIEITKEGTQLTVKKSVNSKKLQFEAHGVHLSRSMAEKPEINNCTEAIGLIKLDCDFPKPNKKYEYTLVTTKLNSSQQNKSKGQTKRSLLEQDISDQNFLVVVGGRVKISPQTKITQESMPFEHKNWNQFRGPSGNGQALGKSLPIEFSENKNLRWKTTIHDDGYSSPVIWNKQIWVTTASYENRKLYAVCVDLKSGEILHDIKVFDVKSSQLQSKRPNSHASPTPVIEEGRVYVHFGTYGTACLDTETGQKLWERRDLNCYHEVRPGSSPIINDNLLYLIYDGVDKQFIVALDKYSGETIWLKNDRSWKSSKSGMTAKSFATPTIIKHQGKKQLIAPSADYTIAYEPKSGDELWRIRYPDVGMNVASRPIYENDLVFLTTGTSKHLLAVNPSGRGNVTDTNIVWRNHKGIPDISSPLIVNGLVFFTNEGGMVSCLDLKSGKSVWKGRVGGNHWASPIYQAGKIYFFSQEGRVSVISAGVEFKKLAVSDFETRFVSSPAVSNGALVLRSSTHLYCFSQIGN